MIPANLEVICKNTTESREALLIFLRHGYMYWPEDEHDLTTKNSLNTYLDFFKKYLYIKLSYDGTELYGNDTQTEDTTISFSHFRREYSSNKLRMHRMVKDLLYVNAL